MNGAKLLMGRESYMAYYGKEECFMVIDKVLVVKIAGMVMTVGGMIASNWSGKKEQEKTLAKEAKKYFDKTTKGS